jgi:hypothetical protein
VRSRTVAWRAAAVSAGLIAAWPLTAIAGDSRSSDAGSSAAQIPDGTPANQDTPRSLPPPPPEPPVALDAPDANALALPIPDSGTADGGPEPHVATSLMAPVGRFWSLSAQGAYRAIFASQPASGGLFASTPLVGVSAIVHNALAPRVGIEIDGQYGWASGQLNTRLIRGLGYSGNSLELGIALLYEHMTGSSWVPFVGLRVAYATFNRSFSTSSYVASDQSLTTGLVGGLVGLKYCFTPKLALAARVRIAYLPASADGSSGAWSGDFGGFLEYAFGAEP